MVNGNERPEQEVLTRLAHLNATIEGTVAGVVLGGIIFLATNFLVLKGGPVVGPHLALLGEFLPGYEVSFLGSLLGLAYGFAIGFLIGYVLALLYNWLADRRNGRGSRPARDEAR